LETTCKNFPPTILRANWFQVSPPLRP
jgi:hypothetical protein